MVEKGIFYIKDCSVATIATGKKAQSLIELRDCLAKIDAWSIFYHFWMSRLGTTFEFRDYQNEFALWSKNCLHDEILSERLELLDPTEYDTIEHLRADLIEVIETRLDEKEYLLVSRRDEQFHFKQAKVIVFHTKHQLVTPIDLVTVLPKLSHSSIFYHFIDSALRTTEGKNDFSIWLKSQGEEFQALIQAFDAVDPYFNSLAELQQKLIQISQRFFHA